MHEIEAKIRITREEFEKLANLFNRPVFFNQENILYEIPGGFVRIRREKDKKILTLKKEIPGEFNSREEIEFETKSELSSVKDFLERLGLKEQLKFRKRRANIYKNECTISLDIIGEDNHYIEIEGEPERIRELIKELNLEGHELESRSYFEILSNGMH